MDKSSDYLALQPGKYIIYRTDSTVFTNFNRNTEVHSYQEKQVVDAEISDNLGNPSYRVFRYMRDTAGVQPWVPAGTLMITPLRQSVEVVENNLRYVKLAEPLSVNSRWLGNHYLPSEPYKSLYEFSNDDAMGAWEYKISGMHESLSLNGQTIDDVLTIDQVNQSVNVPLTFTDYAYLNYSVEKYARGIGLVYQEYTMWEFQPPLNGGPKTNGFGVKRSMIEHN